MVRMHIVESWRLFLLSSATLWRSRSIHGVESTGAHGMRTCHPFASSAFRSAASACRHLQRVVVHGRAESLSTDSAEGTQLLLSLRPVKDRRTHKIEEVQIAR